MVAEATTPEVLFEPLVASARDPAGVGAAAAVALRIEANGRVVIAASAGLPPGAEGWSEELESVGPELGARLASACAPGLGTVHTEALVAGGDIYGALVAFAAPASDFTSDQLAFAQAVAALVAVGMEKAARYAALARSYAELRASREVLAKTETLRALGEMAAGVSHDIKNILNPLALHCELLRRRIPSRPEAALEVVATMEDAIRSGVEVVERLRAFSRQKPEPAAEAVELNRVIETVVELCRPRLESVPGLALRTEPGRPPVVRARHAELVSAVVNLVFNAIDALSARGTGRIVLRTGGDAQRGWLEVDDDGPGMPPEIERRVFEPFFTTKEQGTGLGLAMVYAFVKRHGGDVELHTKPGAGTRFRLCLPTPT